MRTSQPSSLFSDLRRDVDRMLTALGLSQDEVKRTLPSDTCEGGHDEEPNQSPQRELLDGDEEQRSEAPVSVMRAESGYSPRKRRVLSVAGVPLVRVALDPDRDVPVDLSGPLATAWVSYPGGDGKWPGNVYMRPDGTLYVAPLTGLTAE
jgi:hypothetical protein